MSKVLQAATLIYNPKAGRRQHARVIEGIKAALGTTYDVRVAPTHVPKEATTLAREAAVRGDAAVFAWGGDGTIREVAEGILGSPVMLGVLPGGTFNVVALAVGLPNRPVAAAWALSTARPSPRDVGLIETTPFLMQATAGLDAFIMDHLRPDMKARFGRVAVLLDGLRAFSMYRFEPFDVDVDGHFHTVTGAAFVNMSEYAGRYQYVPGGRWDDGLAHVVLYTGRTHLQALMFTLSIASGRHHLRKDVVIQEAKSMTILPSKAAHIQTDGDPWKGALPATCRLSSERIQVLIPAAK